MRTKIITGLVILALIFSGCWLLRPVEYQVPSGYDYLGISVSGVPAFKISDPDTVEFLVETINSTTFRKKIWSIREAPDNLDAVIQIRSHSTDTAGADVLLLPSRYGGKTKFIIWTGTEHLVAVDTERLEACMDSLIGNLIDITQ